jgi:hypothetical protein
VALTEQTAGVTSDGITASCGAACTVYIVKLLGATSPPTVTQVMAKTSFFSVIYMLGSTPANIAKYLTNWCQTQTTAVPVTIYRLDQSGRTDWQKYGNRPWLYSLDSALSKYNLFPANTAFTDSHAIIRFLSKKGSAEGHFIVETFFPPTKGTKNHQIMDTWGDPAYIYKRENLDDWIIRNNNAWHKTGLDLVIQSP